LGECPFNSKENDYCDIKNNLMGSFQFSPHITSSFEQSVAGNKNMAKVKAYLLSSVKFSLKWITNYKKPYMLSNIDIL
jgi:hypothetical protein